MRKSLLILSAVLAFAFMQAGNNDNLQKKDLLNQQETYCEVKITPQKNTPDPLFDLAQTPKIELSKEEQMMLKMAKASQGFDARSSDGFKDSLYSFSPNGKGKQSLEEKKKLEMLKRNMKAAQGFDPRSSDGNSDKLYSSLSSSQSGKSENVEERARLQRLKQEMRAAQGYDPRSSNGLPDSVYRPIEKPASSKASVVRVGQTFVPEKIFNQQMEKNIRSHVSNPGDPYGF